MLALGDGIHLHGEGLHSTHIVLKIATLLWEAAAM